MEYGVAFLSSAPFPSTVAHGRVSIHDIKWAARGNRTGGGKSMSHSPSKGILREHELLTGYPPA